MVSDPLCVAVGECGVDFAHVSVPDRETQLRAFAAQVRIAVDAGKPVVVHARAAAGDSCAGDVVQVLAGAGADFQRCLVHCFTGGEADLALLVERGAAVSFAGRLCDPDRGADTRRAVQTCWRLRPGPPRFTIGTDSPYLPPPPEALLRVREEGFPFAFTSASEPAHLPALAAALGELTGQSAAAAAAHATEVCESVLRLQEATARSSARQPRAARFLVPATMSKLCRQLRGLGIDVLMLPDSKAKTIVEAGVGVGVDHLYGGQIGDRTGRVFVNLHCKSVLAEAGSCCMPVHKLGSSDSKEQLRELIARDSYQLKPSIHDLCGRCVLCNASDWRLQGSEDVKGDVEESVRERYDSFWRCGGCQKVYWEGNVHRQSLIHFSRFVSGSEDCIPPPVPVTSPGCAQARREAKKLPKEVLVLCSDPLRGWLVCTNRTQQTVPTVLLDREEQLGGWEGARTAAARALRECVSEGWSVAAERFCRVPPHPSQSRRVYVLLHLNAGDRGAVPCGRWSFVPDAAQASSVAKLGSPPDTELGSQFKNIRMTERDMVLRPPEPASRRCPLLCLSPDVPDVQLRLRVDLASSAYEEAAGRELSRRADSGEQRFRTMRRLQWDWQPEPHVPRRQPAPPRPPTSVRPGPLRQWLLRSLAGDASLERAARARAAVEAAVGDGVWVFGSAATGSCDAADPAADVDLYVETAATSCIGVDGPPTPAERDRERAALAEVARRAPLDGQELVLSARVPVLRGVVRGTATPCDITLRRLGVHNTALLRAYFDQSPAARSLALLVRRWADWAAVRASEKGLPSSYCLVLMLLSWMLRAAHLRHVPPDLLSADCRRQYPSYAAAETDDAAGLAAMLLQFIRFYGYDFDWDASAVCIAEPPEVTKASQEWSAAAAAVRDPFEQHVNLLRHMKRNQRCEVIRRFQLSFEHFADGWLCDAYH
eukprot:TRINITY_DN14183_c0_g1_i1.p1 TRINITY_DN14183_c0_g1~~TRINITY_DN14183_c0_g1_i1.p1  ORF type:complete len:939 (+),score=283.37 TRINITY_DN14183_c0_g1_i1:385-3201(+)